MSICGQSVWCASAPSWPPARPHPGISQSKQSDPGSISIRYDVISTFLCLILCCWHWGGCKLCVNMSSLCINTCFGASHRNYGDRRQILRCVALWVGVFSGSIVRDSPSTSHFKLISPANIVLFGPYWYSEMSVDHGMCALVNISIVNNVATVSIIRKFTASPVNQPIRRLLVSWGPLDVRVATAVIEVTKQADWLILSHSGASRSARWTSPRGDPRS